MIAGEMKIHILKQYYLTSKVIKELIRSLIFKIFNTSMPCSTFYLQTFFQNGFDRYFNSNLWPSSLQLLLIVIIEHDNSKRHFFSFYLWCLANFISIKSGTVMKRKNSLKTGIMSHKVAMLYLLQILSSNLTEFTFVYKLFDYKITFLNSQIPKVILYSNTGFQRSL